MGQHKHNKTAQLAKKGKLEPKINGIDSATMALIRKAVVDDAISKRLNSAKITYIKEK